MRLVALVSASVLFLSANGSGPALSHEGDDHVKADRELTAEEQSVVDTLTAYTGAVAKADLEAVKAVVVADDNFSYVEGSHLDLGWESFAKHMAPEFAAFGDASYEFSEILPYVDGSMAYAHLRYAMDVVILSDQFEGGKHPVSMKGAGTVVLVKVGDEWKIRHMHMVQDAKPAAPPADD